MPSKSVERATVLVSMGVVELDTMRDVLGYIKTCEDEIERLRDQLGDPEGVIAHAKSITKVRAEEIARLKAQLERQSYTYIGKDGKSVLARDLEDERDELKAENERLRQMVGRAGATQ